MAQFDADRIARRGLRRQRGIATALLGVMAALMVGSHALRPGFAASWLQAAGTAGFVGGVADWFAVVALFRHPLGLPIPHTAILPAQKNQLGASLGRFLAQHVFTAEEVARVVLRLDVPGILARALSDATITTPAARGLARLVPRLLAKMEDGSASRLARIMLARLLHGQAGGLLAARALRGLVASGHHQQVLTLTLTQMRGLLASQETQLRTLVEDRVREQGGRLIGWAVGASIASRVLNAVNTELDKIGPDGSELREAFDVWVLAEITRLETDPAHAAKIGHALGNLLKHEAVSTWLHDLWARLRTMVVNDATRPQGRTETMVQEALAQIGAVLNTEQAARQRVQSAAEGLALGLLPQAQAKLAGFIAGVVASWDSAVLVDRLELRVGRDLQYIRMNGTLVGFLLGGLVFLATHAMFGHAGW